MQLSIEVDPKPKISPDLTILVRRDDTNTNKFRFKYTLFSSRRDIDLHFRECESPELGEKYLKLISKRFDLINASMKSRQSRDRLTTNLKNYGKKLYEALFNYEFDKIYWDSIYEKVRSVQIISKESIPWEIIYPMRLGVKDNIPGKGFLTELHNIAHWFPPHAPADTIEVDSLNMVRALSDDFAIREEDSIRALLPSHDTRCCQIEPCFDEVKSIFVSSSRAITHMICHGSVGKEDADQAILRLNDIDLQPDDIEACPNGQDTNHLIFLNGCETGSIGPGISGLGGWAFNLVSRSCANVVLGPIWKVSGESACEFAIAFYESLYPKRSISEEQQATQVSSSQSVLEAVRVARKKAKGNDPTRLSYKIYGNPLVAVSKQARSIERT